MQYIFLASLLNDFRGMGWGTVLLETRIIMAIQLFDSRQQFLQDIFQIVVDFG
jgi:hypothetical protein